MYPPWCYVTEIYYTFYESYTQLSVCWSNMFFYNITQLGHDRSSRSSRSIARLPTTWGWQFSNRFSNTLIATCKNMIQTSRARELSIHLITYVHTTVFLYVHYNSNGVCKWKSNSIILTKKYRRTKMFTQRQPSVFAPYSKIYTILFFVNLFHTRIINLGPLHSDGRRPKTGTSE